MSKSENYSRSRSNNKNNHDKKEDKKNLRPTLTLNQLKLAVALELKAEDFETVIFDRVVEFGGQRVKVHVFCEDDVGARLAVYCIHRADQMDPYKVFDVINAIRNGMEDCDVALAFPLALLPWASPIIGMTSRVFMVDSEGRVWSHYPWQGSRLIEVFRKTEEGLLKREEEEDEDLPTIANRDTHLRVFYIV